VRTTVVQRQIIDSPGRFHARDRADLLQHSVKKKVIWAAPVLNLLAGTGMLS